jgi:SAM-dependent methyltransferase/uncharacterized protein YbaR (Trm112 family)
VLAALLDVLVSPGDRSPLVPAEPEAFQHGSVEEGALLAGDGRVFPIRAGVPRFVESTGQEETAASFGAKWASFRDEQRTRLPDFQYRWLEERYGFGDEAGLERFLDGREWILDAGTGPAIHSSRYARLSGAQVVGLDLSESVTAAHADFADLENLHLVQGDILDPPFAPASFDFVISDQVIHHTPDAPRAFATLAELVRPGGELAVYVYRVKPLLRELADEHVRELTTRLSIEECMAFSEQVTELGRALSSLEATVTLERGVPLLGIEPGDHDVQRLLYWHFFKAFWNEDLGEGISTMVNFDWYHPPYASRHTEEEVIGWCDAAGLEVVHLDTMESGISVRAERVA